MDNAPYIKMIAVIDSCRTLEQLNAAEKYAALTAAAMAQNRRDHRRLAATFSTLVRIKNNILINLGK